MAPKESILASIPAQYFPLTIVIGTIGTIATTYTLSTYQGHSQPFPHTDITHTARFPPERYVFRVGMLIMAVVMAWNWNMLYNWMWNVNERVQSVTHKIAWFNKKTAGHDDDEEAADEQTDLNTSNPPEPQPTSQPALHTIFYLGLLSCVSITISSMCITSNSDMPWTMHVIGATSFFVFCLIAQAVTTYKSYRIYKQLEQAKEDLAMDENLAASDIGKETQQVVFISSRSLYAKIAISSLSFAMLGVSIFSSLGMGDSLMMGQLSNSAAPSLAGTSFSKININGGAKIVGSGLGSSVVNAMVTAAGYDVEARLKSTTSNVVEWSCTLLIVIYFITFALDWTSAKLLTSIGQLTPTTVQKNRRAPKKASQPIVTAVPVTPNYVVQQHDFEQNQPAHFRVYNHEMQHIPSQNPQIFVYPNTSRPSQQHTSLYPSTYNIQ